MKNFMRPFLFLAVRLLVSQDPVNDVDYTIVGIYIFLHNHCPVNSDSTVTACRFCNGQIPAV